MSMKLETPDLYYTNADTEPEPQFHLVVEEDPLSVLNVNATDQSNTTTNYDVKNCPVAKNQRPMATVSDQHSLQSSKTASYDPSLRKRKTNIANQSSSYKIKNGREREMDFSFLDNLAKMDSQEMNKLMPGANSKSKSHGNTKSITCADCSQIFMNQLSFKCHRCTIDKYTCSVCRQRFHSIKTKQLHEPTCCGSQEFVLPPAAVPDKASRLEMVDRQVYGTSRSHLTEEINHYYAYSLNSDSPFAESGQPASGRSSTSTATNGNIAVLTNIKSDVAMDHNSNIGTMNSNIGTMNSNIGAMNSNIGTMHSNIGTINSSNKTGTIMSTSNSGTPRPSTHTNSESAELKSEQYQPDPQFLAAHTFPCKYCDDRFMTPLKRNSHQATHSDMAKYFAGEEV